jgi:phosphate transport system substrate-binding protein
MKISVSIVAVLSIALLSVSKPYAADLKIGAGAAPTENILKPLKGAFESASGINLAIIDSGPKNALLDLDRGMVEAAAAGLNFNDWMALMKKEGVEVKDPSLYQSVTIGKDKVVVFTNKANKVSALTPEQIKGIFSGDIASWKEVGGDDQPILVVWGKMTQGTNNMFAKKFMGDKAVSKEVIDATTAADVRQNVVSNPSAVGIGPQAIIDASVKVLQTPELARDITLVTKGKPSPNVQKLLDFIKGDGQKLIK